MYNDFIILKLMAELPTMVARMRTPSIVEVRLMKMKSSVSESVTCGKVELSVPLTVSLLSAN